jgi:uncharacterized protein YgbK (DUF1537 family)
MNVCHHDALPAVDRRPANAVGRRQHGTGQGPLVGADDQLAILQEIEPRPEEMGHLAGQQGADGGHAGHRVGGPLGALVEQFAQLLVDALVAGGKLIGSGGHGHSLSRGNQS